MRRQDGAAAVPLLGAVLVLLLLVGGLGLAEGARANACKARAHRALAAAVQSAAGMDRHDEAAMRRAFEQVLRANMGTQRYTAHLEFPDHGLTATLEMPYRFEYLAAFLPEARLTVVQTAPAAERKPGRHPRKP